jgi:hypothetical protein
MVTPQSPLGGVKERPACCRVVCFGGLWVFSRVCGFFLVFGWALLWVVWAFFLGFWGHFFVFCQLLRVSFWCFLCILPVYQGAPLRFFNKYFLTYRKKKKEKKEI